MFSSNGSQVSADANFIEDVFSTYLYDGTGSNQTITNGIDLSGEGGLVWGKCRETATYVDHNLFDTTRGFTKKLMSNQINGESDLTSDGPVALSNGFSIKANTQDLNNNAKKHVSWTFRKQAKFFDIVTYTGNGANRTIAHSLGSAPGCILVKAISGTGAESEGWRVYHRSQGATKYAMLQSTNAFATASSVWNNTEPTSTEFTVGTDTGANGSGLTFIAYLFAHDAGGFGLTGTDNVISCGSLTADNPGGGAYAGGATVNLGYEPQFVLLKEADSTDSDPNWIMVDTFRGYRAQETSGSDVGQQRLRANTSGAEADAGGCSFPTSTGFSALQLTGGATYIYIAIRRGPMKTPTVGTSVFSPVARTGTGTTATVTGVGFPPDLMIVGNRTGVSGVTGHTADRLRGKFTALRTNATTAEISDSSLTTDFLMDGVSLGSDSYDAGLNKVMTYVNWFFKRAPGFFDEVCYTGTGSATTFSHNLAAVPELIIVKGRSLVGYSWFVYDVVSGNTKASLLNTTGIPTAYAPPAWNNTTPTSTVFSVGTGSGVNESAQTYVAYLFATCAGVSKVGSYTGTGTTLQINCGFTAGARFVLIKRTDSTGDWYVWDTVRGIIAGNDPYLLLNSSAAETTNTDYIDTYNAGFELSSTAPAAINASGGTYLFLAIA